MTDEIESEVDEQVADVEAPELRQYDEKYVQKLKKDLISWKGRAAENRQAMQKAEDAEKRLQETENRSAQALQEVAEMRKVAENRLISAELKSIAVEMGLKKMEYSRLADMSSVKVLESGDIQGVREALAKLKDTDPDLFKMATTTNIHFTSGQSVDNINKKKIASAELSELSEAEYKKAEKDFLRSNRR